ncbi:MAG: RDD family protein [Acidimicrobiales bacterium]
MSDIPPPPPPNLPPPPPGDFGGPPPGYTTTYGAPTTTPMEYAGFGARLAAAVIDGVITFVLFIPAVLAIAGGPKRITTCSVDSSGNVTLGEEINGFCEVPTGGTIVAAILLGILGLVALLLYYAKLEGGPSGQTIGKKAVNIRVVDANSGGPIGGGRAVGRYMFRAFISGNICFLGYLWMLWDGRKQTWHDKVVTSVVVKA